MSSPMFELVTENRDDTTEDEEVTRERIKKKIIIINLHDCILYETGFAEDAE